MVLTTQSTTGLPSLMRYPSITLSMPIAPDILFSVVTRNIARHSDPYASMHLYSSSVASVLWVSQYFWWNSRATTGRPLLPTDGMCSSRVSIPLPGMYTPCAGGMTASGIPREVPVKVFSAQTRLA